MWNPIRLSKIFTVMLLFSIGTIPLQAQDLPYETITVEGQTYYKYNVQPGEGLYAVSRTFSVSVAEILRHNPGADSGLQSGQQLLIPVTGDAAAQEVAAHVDDASSPESPPADQNRTFTHTVVKGETLYSISQMYHTTVDALQRLNPGASEDLDIGRKLTIPQRRVISEVKEENYRYHTILPKETLYSLSRTYKLKPEDVMRANPGLTVETFQIGRTIRIPFFESYEMVTPYDNQTSNIVHQVKRGETLYSIAKKYNVSVAAIKQQNPMLSNGLKTNMELIVPVRREEMERESRTVEDEVNRLLSQERPSRRVDVIKVALLLPFLDHTGGGHLRLQEYYEGFLLAVEQLKNAGVDLELYVFEIGKGDNTRKLESLLGTLEMQSLHLIVGGVNDAQIKVISDFSKAYNVKYVVPFSQSNGEVLNNGHVFQVNPLSSAVDTKAAAQFVKTFRDANVIFVRGGRNDKAAFIATLQRSMQQHNQPYQRMDGLDSFNSAIIPLLSSNRENVIVPASGDSNTLRQIITALKMFPEDSDDYAISLFGHPEWQTYANFYGDYHLFNTYIYTPFFVDENERQTRLFRDNFHRWYSRNLMDTHPSYGLWGYDTALFFLTALKRYGSAFEQHIADVRVNTLQFAFTFERMNNWGGFVNNGLFLVHYDRNGQIIKTDISR